MTTTATAVKFHVGLHVSDRLRSVRFYRVLLGVEPVRDLEDHVRFELEDPPLVLVLVPSPQLPGGALNHLGLRVPDAAALVAVQRRLEEAGITTQRQEGVECCYSRQTKFWVADPDRNLWELYVFEEDLEHSGFDGPPPASAVSRAAADVVWEHRLTEPVPARVPQADASVDEVRLEGSLNADLAAADQARLFAEARRVLRPGGRLVVHGLVSDRAFPGKPDLPGLASLVRRVPTQEELAVACAEAGFAALQFEKLGQIHCFQAGGVELREARLVGLRPAGSAPAGFVLYRGPFAQVEGEDGRVYRRGERVRVEGPALEQLRLGPAAGQFLFFSEEK